MVGVGRGCGFGFFSINFLGIWFLFIIFYYFGGFLVFVYGYLDVEFGEMDVFEGRGGRVFF